MFATVKRNPFVLPMAVVAALAILFISEGSYWQSLDSIGNLRGLALARTQVDRLMRNLTVAESGQRGYLLSGQSEYLLPYVEARTACIQALQQLDSHYLDDQRAAAVIAKLRQLTDRKLAELQDSVGLMQAGQRQAALDRMLGGSGVDDMAQVRALTREFQDQQAAEREATNRSLDRTLLLSRLGMAALSAVLLIALVLYLRKGDALAQARAQQQRLAQAAHDRLEVEVAQRTAQLTDLTRHLLTTREDERHRLARNLHDDLGSLLTAAKLDAARIKSRLAGTNPEVLARLADLVGKLNSGIALGRTIIEDLRPSTLSHLGLLSTLEILVRDFAAGSGVQVHLDVQPVALSPGAELAVFRVVQESITNLSKYAGAKQVWLGLQNSVTRPGFVEVTVRDDGKGFDADAPARSAFGLLGMRFRVEAEGGVMRLQSQPGQGTLVSVWLPALPPGANEREPDGAAETLTPALEARLSGPM